MPSFFECGCKGIGFFEICKKEVVFFTINTSSCRCADFSPADLCLGFDGEQGLFGLLDFFEMKLVDNGLHLQGNLFGT